MLDQCAGEPEYGCGCPQGKLWTESGECVIPDACPQGRLLFINWKSLIENQIFYKNALTKLLDNSTWYEFLDFFKIRQLDLRDCIASAYSQNNDILLS